MSEATVLVTGASGGLEQAVTRSSHGLLATTSDDDRARVVDTDRIELSRVRRAVLPTMLRRRRGVSA